MTSRFQKITALCLVFLIACNPPAHAWLCTGSLLEYDTEEECKRLCPRGGTCIEQDTYLCRPDGGSELQECVQGPYCEFGGEYPCRDDYTCTGPAECTALNAGEPYFECGATTTKYQDQAACNESCPSECTEANATFTHWTCSDDSIVYETYFQCNGSCWQQGSCSDQWLCPSTNEPTCADAGSSASYTYSPPPGPSGYENDGPVDDNTGECLGHIFIFNGREMECEESSFMNGFHDCCDADQDMVDEMGEQMRLLSNTLSTLNSLKNAYDAATAAVGAFEMLSSSMGSVESSEAAITTATELYGETATEAASAAIAEGGSATTAATNGVTMAMINPTTIVIAVVVYLVMEWLMQSCSPDDMLTAAYNELGLCHRTGKRCTAHFLGSCSQWVKVFCCFNSKLARIIHEQGRPQLRSFTGNWEVDTCRGFTPEEFQMLDFSKLDLSEYYSDIQTRVEAEIQTDINTRINEYQTRIGH